MTEPPDPARDPEIPRDDGALVEDDDLVDAPLVARRRRRARRLLALGLAAALLIPSVALLSDEVRFRTSGGEVATTLGDDAALAETVWLVRAVGCDGAVVGGSAFVADLGDGPVVVTNRHVVAGARLVSVRPMDGGATVTAQEHRVSRDADVAVLVLPADALPDTVLRAAPSAAVVGAAVRLLGFPAGRPTLGDGVVVGATADRLEVGVRTEPGASGSPVLDVDGRVVGQITARLADGTGVATPLDVLRRAAAGAEPAPGCP